MASSKGNTDDENLCLIEPKEEEEARKSLKPRKIEPKSNNALTDRPHGQTTPPSFASVNFTEKKKQRTSLRMLAQKRKQFLRLIKAICLILILLPTSSLAQLIGAPSNGTANPQQPLYDDPTQAHQQQMDANLSSSSSFVISDPGPADAQQEQLHQPPNERSLNDDAILPLDAPIQHDTFSLFAPSTGAFGSIADPLAQPLMDDPSAQTEQQEQEPIQLLSNEPLFEPSTKRRQYIPPGNGAAIGANFAAPGGLPGGQGLAFAGPGGPIPPPGVCPSGGPSLPPQCPPQSYCFATNTVDIGPYFCCPIWSTYGAAWRPATPFYNYAPPPPPNWPDVMRLGALAQWPAGAVGLPPLKKNRKEPRFATDEPTDTTPASEDQERIITVMNDWIHRQEDLEAPAATASGLEQPTNYEVAQPIP